MTTRRKEMARMTPRVSGDLTALEEMDRWFDTLFQRGWLGPFHDIFSDWPRFGVREFDLRMPKVDVLDREDEILVQAELPGVEKKDLDVNLSERTLTINGETDHKKEQTEGEYYQSEITRGRFSRTIRLAEDVDVTQTKAEFKDGVLEIRLPKTHKVERQKIEIK
jgi:HSP20 family protein